MPSPARPGAAGTPGAKVPDEAVRLVQDLRRQRMEDTYIDYYLQRTFQLGPEQVREVKRVADERTRSRT